MDASASVQGVAVAVGVALATRRGTLCVQRKTRRSRWLKVSAGLLVLTAPILILSVLARLRVFKLVSMLCALTIVRLSTPLWVDIGFYSSSLIGFCLLFMGYYSVVFHFRSLR